MPEINTDYIINDLTSQIAKMSREKAMYFALATERQQENDELKKEIETLKK